MITKQPVGPPSSSPLWKEVVIVIAIGFVVAMTLFLVGCSTVTPTVDPKNDVISWDGNEQNAGLICMLADHSAIISHNAYLRYNALIDKYGTDPFFLPPLKKNEGVSRVVGTINGKEVYQLDAQHLVYFQKMAGWQALNRPAP